MVLFGATGFGFWKFVIFNILSLIIWAFLYIGLGYIFGKTAETVFGQAKKYYLYIGLVIVILGLIYILYVSYKSKKRNEN